MASISLSPASTQEKPEKSHLDKDALSCPTPRCSWSPLTLSQDLIPSHATISSLAPERAQQLAARISKGFYANSEGERQRRKALSLFLATILSAPLSGEALGVSSLDGEAGCPHAPGEGLCRSLGHTVPLFPQKLQPQHEWKEDSKERVTSLSTAPPCHRH